MIQSIQAKYVRTGMHLILGQVPYKITHTETKDDGNIQFYLTRFNIKSSLLTKPNDDLTIDS